MRPINKGTCPQINGVDKTVTDYKDWRLDLIRRIGYFCVYCNRPLEYNLQVEHVVAKNPLPGMPAGNPLNWDNMLLACGPCNNAKDNTNVNAALFYLPEEHNTHLPFTITTHPRNTSAAIVEAAAGLLTIQTTKANDTIELLKLQQIDERDAIVDLRWMKRRNAMIKVSYARLLYNMAIVSPTYDADVVATDIAHQALGVGFFSLWYTAFADRPDVMSKLIDNNIIPGTAQNCFDINNGYVPVNRNPLDINDPF